MAHCELSNSRLGPLVHARPDAEDGVWGHHLEAYLLSIGVEGRLSKVCGEGGVWQPSCCVQEIRSTLLHFSLSFALSPRLQNNPFQLKFPGQS